MSKRRPGRPPKNIVVPHPGKGDQWLEIGAYDETWPAANRYWILRREGMSRADALATAAAEFGLSEQRLEDWTRRARKRGPIEHDE